MNINTLVENMSLAAYNSLSEAVETGKWADGTPLNEQQKAQTLQLVMAYQSIVLKSTEHFAVGENGEIVVRSKDSLRNQFSDTQPDLKSDIQSAQDNDSAAIARFRHDDL